MTSLTLSAAELTLLCAALVLLISIPWWLYQRRHITNISLLQREFYEADHNHLMSQEKLSQQLTHLEESRDFHRDQAYAQAEQLKNLQEKLGDCEKQLAASRQLADRIHGLEKLVFEKDEEYKQLLADHRSLEARAAAEKNGMEEKLALLQETREQLNKEFQLLANKIFEDKQTQFAEQSKQTISASVDPLKIQIEAFRKKVEDVYDKENTGRSQLMGQIVELQKQTRQIGEDAINLTNALKGDNKAQGNWGEVILERLLEESGLQKGREYEVQVGLKDEHGSRRNPDVVIRLPENKDIVIDSKVSLVHYEQYINSKDGPEREKLLKLHLSSLRTHIQQLSNKSYDKLEAIRSLDFVFLFIPIEAAFMTALQADQSLFREAYDRHIILVSPTTLLASLRTVENIWRHEKQNRNAEEIARQAGGLHDQFVLVLEAMSDLERQLDRAGGAFELVNKRLVSGNGNLIRRVDNLRKLGAKTKKHLPNELLPDASLELLEDESND